MSTVPTIGQLRFSSREYMHEFFLEGLAWAEINIPFAVFGGDDESDDDTDQEASLPNRETMLALVKRHPSFPSHYKDREPDYFTVSYDPRTGLRGFSAHYPQGVSVWFNYVDCLNDYLKPRQPDL